jgi:electron transfer flavoprotein alpha subunit
MDTILLLLHTESDGTLARPALEALTAACSLRAELSTELTVGLIGSVVQPVATRMSECGLRVLTVSDEAFAQARYATDAAAAEALCKAGGASLVLAPSTSRWARALPGVAYRLGGRVDTHATAIAARDGAPCVTRWFYRQRMEAVLTRVDRPWFVLLDPGCHAPWEGAAQNADTGASSLGPRACIFPPVSTRTTVVGVQAPKSDQQTIRPDAKLLLVAGAGWTKKQADGSVHAAEAESLILGFLGAAKASLGGSKSLVDLGGEGQAVLRCMTHMNQIGQTGSTPRHAKGLSTCCHGEEPHVVGWRFVSQRRAINLDANCGWARGKADVLYVADAFEVMRHVNRLMDA